MILWDSNWTNLLLEPFHRIIFGHTMLETNPTLALTPMWNSETRTAQHHIEIHAIDSNTWVIFDTKINVFLNTKPKVSSCWEVFLTQLVLLNLCDKTLYFNQSSNLKNVFFGLSRPVYRASRPNWHFHLVAILSIPDLWLIYHDFICSIALSKTPS